MTALRTSLLALGAVLWIGCSDSATTEPPVTETPSLDLPTSLPQTTIEKLKAATAANIDALYAAVAALPNSVVHSGGNRKAMLARISALRNEIARGNIAEAIHHLQNLRKWVDNCTTPTGKVRGNDKVTDCAAQFKIRALIDSVIHTLLDKLDTTPDVTINQAATQVDPTSAQPILFIVVFSEPVTGFTGSDVSFTGSTAGGALSAAVTGSGENYTVSVSGMTTSGIVRASIPAGAAVDAENNPTLASTSTDNSVQFNGPPPTVTINQAVGQADPATGVPISFDVVFSKPVTGFTESDIVFTGSTAGGPFLVAISGAGPGYTVSVTGMTTNGTVVAAIPAGAVTDAGNQPNAASTSTDNSITFTAGPPSVTINQAAGQSDPTSAATVTFTVQFSEPVTGFTASDISFTGSTAAGTLVATVTGSLAFYTVTVTGMTGSGTIVVSIPAAAAVDANNNPNTASTSTDNTVNWVKP